MNRKKNILITIITQVILFGNIAAQSNQISLNTGYENQSYYSFENGETLNITNNNWDLAFSTDSYSANIRINDGKGVELYTYSDGDTSSWSSINNSTPNILTNPMYNSDTSWEYGAFIMNQASGMFAVSYTHLTLPTKRIV